MANGSLAASPPMQIPSPLAPLGHVRLFDAQKRVRLGGEK